MVGEIDKLIKERGLKAGDAEYHTIRTMENGGRVRALVIKGEKTVHLEYICPQCKHAGYKHQEWKDAGKGAKFRFSFKCDKCGFEIKVPKLKGGPKEKKA
jgi:peptide subunit release factor 1 (eRF1)